MTENKEKKESLIKGVFTYSISTWANLVLGLLSVIITTRVLDPTDYGMITLFISATATLMFIISLGMDGAYIRFFNEPPKGNTKNQLLYKNIVYTTLNGLALAAICIGLFGDSVSEFLFGVGSRFLLGLLFLYTICQVFLRFLNITFRMSFKAKQYNIQNIMINSATRILIILAALINNNYLFILSVLTLGVVALLVVYAFFQKKEILPYDQNNELSFRMDLTNYRPYLRFALFSAPTYIVVYLNAFLSQEIIRVKLDAYLLGIFASTGMFATILSAVQGGFSTYWSAYTYKNYHEENEKIKATHNYVVLFSILMAAGLVCFRDLIYLFIGEGYHESKAFFSLLLVAPVLNFIRETTDKGIAISNKNEYSLLVHTMAVIVNVGLCFLLIPIWGIMGAAVANAISAVVLFTSSTIIGQHFYSSITSPLKTIAGVSMALLILTIPALTMNIAYIIISEIIVVGITLLIYSKETVFSYNMIKSNLKHIRK